MSYYRLLRECIIALNLLALIFFKFFFFIIPGKIIRHFLENTFFLLFLTPSSTPPFLLASNGLNVVHFAASWNFFITCFFELLVLTLKFNVRSHIWFSYIHRRTLLNIVIPFAVILLSLLELSLFHVSGWLLGYPSMNNIYLCFFFSQLFILKEF